MMDGMLDMLLICFFLLVIHEGHDRNANDGGHTELEAGVNS